MLLTGSLDDGTAGIAAIKAAGGITIVQDPGRSICAGDAAQCHRIGAGRSHPADSRYPDPGIGAGRRAGAGPACERRTSAPAAYGAGPRRDAARASAARTARASRRSLPARNVMARSGKRTTAVCCASAAESDTCTHRKRCFRHRPTKWIARCGRRCARSKSAPRWPTSWRSARGSGSIRWSTEAFTERAVETEREANLIRQLLYDRSLCSHSVPDELSGASGPACLRRRNSRNRRRQASTAPPRP